MPEMKLGLLTEKKYS